MLRSLEAGEQVDQEGMVRHIHNFKDALLTHETTERRVNERQGGKQGDGGEGILVETKDWKKKKDKHIIRVYSG